MCRLLYARFPICGCDLRHSLQPCTLATTNDDDNNNNTTTDPLHHNQQQQEEQEQEQQEQEQQLPSSCPSHHIDSAYFLVAPGDVSLVNAVDTPYWGLCPYHARWERLRDARAAERMLRDEEEHQQHQHQQLLLEQDATSVMTVLAPRNAQFLETWGYETNTTTQCGGFGGHDDEGFQALPQWEQDAWTTGVVHHTDYSSGAGPVEILMAGRRDSVVSWPFSSAADGTGDQTPARHDDWTDRNKENAPFSDAYHDKHQRVQVEAEPFGTVHRYVPFDDQIEGDWPGGLVDGQQVNNMPSSLPMDLFWGPVSVPVTAAGM